MTLRLLILVGFFSVSSVSFSYASLNSVSWQVVSEGENIKVYQSKEKYGDTSLVPVKAEVVLNHPIEKVLTVLTDVPRKKEWMPKAVESKLIARKSIAESIEYVHYSSPWPFQDRVFLIGNKGVYDPKTQSVQVNFSSVERSDVPQKNGLVRGQTLEGHMMVKPLSANKTRLVMSFISDFKGVIPSWVMNIIQRKWPYEFMKGLNRQLEKPDIVINEEFVAASKKIKNP